MKIAIEDVLIKTASIEVKVLTLTRKQVTMGVFRQLDMKCCINQDMSEFKGQIWGRVNYHHKCVEDYVHMHVVWQLDDELCHDIIYRYLKYEKAHLQDISDIYLPEESEENEIEWDKWYCRIEKDTDHLFIAV